MKKRASADQVRDDRFVTKTRGVLPANHTAASANQTVTNNKCPARNARRVTTISGPQADALQLRKKANGFREEKKSN